MVNKRIGFGHLQARLKAKVLTELIVKHYFKNSGYKRMQKHLSRHKQKRLERDKCSPYGGIHLALNIKITDLALD